MLSDVERHAIGRLWERKLQQDALGLPQAERHRNLEPASAELISALTAGIGARRMVEIGGSSGISTIALAVAARATDGRLISIEREPLRQAEARQTIASLDLSGYVEFITGDAAGVLEGLGEVDFAFIDCEKEDYARFFDLLRVAAGGVVVADNIYSHRLTGYVAHVRAHAGVESITLPVGKGLEITRFLPGGVDPASQS